MTIKNGQVASADEVIEMSGCPDAQNVNRILKADTSVFTNELYSGADDFTDANGVMNTVDTTNTTASYEEFDEAYILNFTDEASGDTTNDPDGYTNPGNAFDGSDSTYATKGGGASNSYTSYLGKTFTSKFVGGVYVKAYGALSGTPDNWVVNVVLQTYDGATWSDVKTLSSAGSPSTYEGYYDLSSTVEGVRVRINTGSGGGSPTHEHRLYLLEYGDFDASSSIETDSILNDGIVPKSIVVYGDKTLTTGTSITVDVSDDGGTTFGVTGKSLNSAIDTSTLSGSNIALKFNLATTDTSKTPVLYGYGMVITNS